MSDGKFGVSQEKEKLLFEKMEALNIREQELEEQFILAQGKGGQKVNKTSSCVYLKHLPTGLEVKCQKTRSQALNRYYARKLLVQKMDTLVRGEQSEEQQRIEKIRRQKRKRSKRAKEKMLDAKKQQGAKKQTRKRISPSKID